MWVGEDVCMYVCVPVVALPQGVCVWGRGTEGECGEGGGGLTKRGEGGVKPLSLQGGGLSLCGYL